MIATPEGGHSVVDQHPPVRQPERGKDGHHGYQHLDNLAQAINQLTIS